MSDGPADKPEKPPLPWDPTPPASPNDPTTAWPVPPADPATPAQPGDAAPTADGGVATPAAQPGLISAAPVGWAATPPPAAPVGWTDPAAAAPPPPSTGAPVGWEPVVAARQREVAPGLVMADTVSRLVAYIIDLIILAFVAGIVASLLGFGQGVRVDGDGTFAYDYSVSGAAFTIPLGLLSLVYFVGCWSGGRRATIGQRLFGIQVGNAFDGRALTLEQAVRRWLGLGIFVWFFDLVASARGIVGLIELVWPLALLATTVMSPTKQGLHDKFANTALVRPTGSGTSGLALACAVVVGLIVLLFIVATIALVLLGSQLSDILSRVGSSI